MRLRRALRAGLSALLLGLLCAATWVAPSLAGVDFAHSHPELAATCVDTHLHPFKLIFGQGESTPPTVALEVVPNPGRVATLAAPSRISAAVPSQHRSRAPPRYL